MMDVIFRIMNQMQKFHGIKFKLKNCLIFNKDFLNSLICPKCYSSSIEVIISEIELLRKYNE